MAGVPEVRQRFFLGGLGCEPLLREGQIPACAGITAEVKPLNWERYLKDRRC